MDITARNTNDLAPKVYALLQQTGVHDNSRNGPVLRFDEPVNILLTHPQERVHFSSERDCNPFFHFVEAMAMLAGVNSVPLMAHFAKRMATFSDNGQTFNAFYGTRARVTWGDQLNDVINELANKPNSRQAVVNLWDPADLTRDTKDKACNLMLLFSRHENTINMTSFNRSNDAIGGGVCGANVVHLSFFHEYVAHAVECVMGRWWHVSNNLHVYTENPPWEKLKNLSYNPSWGDFDYECGEREGFECVPLMTSPGEKVTFDHEVRRYCQWACQHAAEGCIMLRKDYEAPFIRDTAVPLFNAWQYHKIKDYHNAHTAATQIKAVDWSVACDMWLERREAAHAQNP